MVSWVGPIHLRALGRIHILPHTNTLTIQTRGGIKVLSVLESMVSPTDGPPRVGELKLANPPHQVAKTVFPMQGVWGRSLVQTQILYAATKTQHS